MSIKGVGQDIAVHQEQPQFKIEKPRVEPQPVQAPLENKTRANENAFGSAMVKEALNRSFDKAEVAAKAVAPPDPPKPPIDYNAVDKKADELIKKNTSDGFFGKSLHEDTLGKDLADLAKTDPALAAAVTDNVFDKIDDGKRNGLAQNFVKNLSSDELRAFAKDDKGREVLGQLKDKISGPFWDNHQDLKNRIDTAIKAADLEKSPEFKKLDKATQSEVLARIGKNEQDGKAVDNLINLSKDGNFATLSPETQKAMLQAYDNRPGDAVFTDSLKALGGKSTFTALSAADQAKVISDLDKFAKTESYHDHGGFIGIGVHSVSDDDRRYLLDKLGDTSIYSQANPGITSVRNTLDKILNGTVKIEAYSEPAKDGKIVFGNADQHGTFHVNRHPDANNAAYGANHFIDTLVHEMNHELNGPSDYNKPDRFLDEYRAFTVGIEATGKTVDAGQQKKIINNLLNVYDNIKDQYNNDPKFKKFIDDSLAGLDKTPPELLDPETMRKNLLKAGFSSDYLNKSGNLDNH